MIDIVKFIFVVEIFLSPYQTTDWD